MIRRNLRVASLAILVAIAIGLCANYARFAPIDDAFISFRYAQNLAAGNGLVFNVGERVEGYTNFLWVILLAPAESIGIGAEPAAKAMGSLFAVLTLLASASLMPRSAERPWWITLLAPALLAANAVFAMWAVHGLETALFAFLLTMAFRADVHAGAAGTSRARAGLWYALATLTRPEALALFLASELYAAVDRRYLDSARPLDSARRPSSWWAAARVYASIVVPFFVARWLYYGDLLPNTFYAKVGFTTASLWRGLAYLGDFFLAPRGILFLALVAMLFGALRDPATRRLGWLSACYLVAIVLDGGDVFPAWRFVVPILPALYVLVQEGVVFLAERARTRVARVVIVVAVVALVALHLQGLVAAAHSESRGAEEFTGGLELAGAALRESFPEGTRLSASPIGAIAYVSRFHVYDHLGLTDRHIARRESPDMGKGVAGHEKGDGWYLMERRPDIVLAGNVLIRRETPAEFIDLPWQVYGITESEFAEHPARARLYVRDAIQLADGRWLYFLRRADAPRARTEQSGATAAPAPRWPLSEGESQR